VSSAAEPDRAAEIRSLQLMAQLAKVDVPEFVAADDRDIVLRGMRFHYLDWGTPGKTPILFLHGGGLNAHTFDLVCLSLRLTYHCMALDQRGHGDSEWSPVLDYGIVAGAGDIEALATALGLRQYVLVGMSLGGLNAIKYAGRHSGDLAGLVIIDVGPEVQTHGIGRIRAFREELPEGGTLDDYVDRAMQFNPRRNPDILRRSLMHNLRRTPSGNLTWKWDPRPRLDDAARQAMDAQRTELWSDVDRISCPTLVIRGANSDVFSEENAERLTARLKRGRAVDIEDAGHTVQGDNPAGLLRELRTFLGGLAI
jgi:esterase